MQKSLGIPIVQSLKLPLCQHIADMYIYFNQYLRFYALFLYSPLVTTTGYKNVHPSTAHLWSHWKQYYSSCSGFGQRRCSAPGVSCGALAFSCGFRVCVTQDTSNLIYSMMQPEECDELRFGKSASEGERGKEGIICECLKYAQVQGCVLPLNAQVTGFPQRFEVKRHKN